METSKRRDCDPAATFHTSQQSLEDGMETSKRRDCDLPFLYISHTKLMDGMETSKRRDCDARLGQTLLRSSLWWNGDLKKKGLRLYCWKPSEASAMEWRPQKEGIATYAIDSNRIGWRWDGMETSKRRDCDEKQFIHPWRRNLRWNGDLKKKGLRPTTKFSQCYIPFLEMEWRPQKEGIATIMKRSNDFTVWPRWNGDLKKKGLRHKVLP